MKNITTFDQYARVFLAVVLLEAAFFWLDGGLKALAYVVGGVLFGTAVFRFCPVYRLFGFRPARAAETPNTAVRAGAAVLLLAVALVGGYGSDFFSRKLFLEDFNAMNHFYKQTLFWTGKDERVKAIANYDQLVPAYQGFQRKYASYRPYALRGDPIFGADLRGVQTMIVGVEGLVRSGDLHQAHLDLEKIRPVFQSLFKRNGFSLLSVALVDFHDAMELMLDAAQARDAGKIQSLYPQVSDKLQAVEGEANDVEIQAIRKNLNDLLDLAKTGTTEGLPPQSDKLKSSFVKVYLKRG